MKKQAFERNEERLRNLSDNFKHSNTQVIEMPEEEGEQEIENLFEKVMKENFPNLAKELDMQVQDTHSQKSWTQRGTGQDTSYLNHLRLKMRES